MVKRPRWTKEEDEILVQAIKANPHNKAKAFMSASERLNRSVNSCNNRWYQCLSNPESKHYVGCIFTMIGISSRFDNRSVSREDTKVTPVKVKRGIWTKIKRLLGIKN